MIDQCKHGSKGKKSEKGKIPENESKQQQGLSNDEQPDGAFAKMIENAHELSLGFRRLPKQFLLLLLSIESGAKFHSGCR